MLQIYFNKKPFSEILKSIPEDISDHIDFFKKLIEELKSVHQEEDKDEEDTSMDAYPTAAATTSKPKSKPKSSDASLEDEVELNDLLNESFIRILYRDFINTFYIKDNTKLDKALEILKIVFDTSFDYDEKNTVVHEFINKFFHEILNKSHTDYGYTDKEAARELLIFLIGKESEVKGWYDLNVKFYIDIIKIGIEGGILGVLKHFIGEIQKYVYAHYRRDRNKILRDAINRTFEGRQRLLIVEEFFFKKDTHEKVEDDFVYRLVENNLFVTVVQNSNDLSLPKDSSSSSPSQYDDGETHIGEMSVTSAIQESAGHLGKGSVLPVFSRKTISRVLHGIFTDIDSKPIGIQRRVFRTIMFKSLGDIGVQLFAFDLAFRNPSLLMSTLTFDKDSAIYGLLFCLYSKKRLERERTPIRTNFIPWFDTKVGNSKVVIPASSPEILWRYKHFIRNKPDIFKYLCRVHKKREDCLDLLLDVPEDKDGETDFDMMDRTMPLHRRGQDEEGEGGGGDEDEDEGDGDEDSPMIGKNGDDEDSSMTGVESRTRPTKRQTIKKQGPRSGPQRRGTRKKPDTDDLAKLKEEKEEIIKQQRNIVQGKSTARNHKTRKSRR
jgi:hypothetical protein